MPLIGHREPEHNRMLPADREKSEQDNLCKLITHQYDAIKDTATFYTATAGSQRSGLFRPTVSPVTINKPKLRSARRSKPHTIPRFLPNAQNNRQVPATYTNSPTVPHQTSYRPTLTPATSTCSKHQPTLRSTTRPSLHPQPQLVKTTLNKRPSEPVQ